MIYKIIQGITLTCMQSHVNLQTAFCSEHAAADVAAECLLTRMNLHMRIQSAFDCEALAAMIALVRSFARMRANVPDEVAWFAESFRTVFAFISIFLCLFLLHIFLNDHYNDMICRLADAKSSRSVQIFVYTYISVVHAFSFGDCIH